MEILIILFLCVAATAKVTIQSRFAKLHVQTAADAVLFNGLIFMCAAVIFSYGLFNCSLETILYGSLFGLFAVIFQVTYVQALAIGNVSLSVMIVNLCMVVPIMLSIIRYGESLTVARGLGILLTIAALVVCTDFKSKAENVRKWLVYIFAAFAANCAQSITQKMYGHTASSGNSLGFVAWCYFAATVLSFVIYTALSTHGQKKTFALRPSAFGYAAAVGIVLGIFQTVYTYANSAIEGTLLFPSYSGGALLCTTLSSVVILKEKLFARQKVSLLIGCVALILMNL